MKVAFIYNPTVDFYNSESPWYTLILPLRIMPYTDGRSWARQNGYDRHVGVMKCDELTDEEDYGN